MIQNSFPLASFTVMVFTNVFSNAHTTLGLGLNHMQVSMHGNDYCGCAYQYVMFPSGMYPSPVHFTCFVHIQVLEGKGVCFPGAQFQFLEYVYFEGGE